ncbi:MAG TPA: acyltransferase [Acidimicrobiia bacterium]|nr:acyltransferase [Acidimicrobiia bacterium]
MTPPDDTLEAMDWPAPPEPDPAPAGAVAHDARGARRMAHFRALDGLRGVAVLAVVLYHFAPGVAPGGFLGVDVFFVLSGFLITSLLVNELEGTRRVSLPAFWRRRARRLLPALFLVLAAIGVWALLLHNHVQAHNVANDALAAVGYIANWHFISSGQTYIQNFVNQTPSPLRHMWSLAIEEQFYLAWPLIVGLVGYVVLRHARRPGRARRVFRRVLVVVCVTLGLASFARMVTLFGSSRDFNRVYYGTDTRAFILLAGAAFGALTAGSPLVSRRAMRVIAVLIGTAVAAGLVVTMAVVPTNAVWLYYGGYGAIALAVVVVLMAAVQPGWNPLRGLLETWPLVQLGLISYGVYLWHWPATVWLTPQTTGLDGPALFGVRSAMTLVASVISYVLVEQPIRKGLLGRLPVSNTGIVPAALVTAVVAVLLIPALAFSSLQPARVARPSTTARVVAAQYGATPRCDAPAPAASTTTTTTRRTATTRVQLVGNSVSQEIRPCLASLLARRGIRVIDAWFPAAAVCDELPHVRQQVASPSTRPAAAILFALPVALTTCGQDEPWVTQVDEALAVWRHAGVHVYLVPAVAKAGTTGPDPTVAQYQAMARRYPADVTVLDAGVFVRDAGGQYQWRMPCVVGGEDGCDRQGEVTVRMAADGGLHFCAEPVKALECPEPLSGGARRAAAAIAAELPAGPLLPAVGPIPTRSK